MVDLLFSPPGTMSHCMSHCSCSYASFFFEKTSTVPLYLVFVAAGEDRTSCSTFFSLLCGARLLGSTWHSCSDIAATEVLLNRCATATCQVFRGDQSDTCDVSDKDVTGIVPELIRTRCEFWQAVEFIAMHTVHTGLPRGRSRASSICVGEISEGGAPIIMTEVGRFMRRENHIVNQLRGRLTRRSVADPHVHMVEPFKKRCTCSVSTCRTTS